MPNQAQNPNVKKIYDLEERAAIFGESIIKFCQSAKQDTITNRQDYFKIKELRFYSKFKIRNSKLLIRY